MDKVTRSANETPNKEASHNPASFIYPVKSRSNPPMHEDPQIARDRRRRMRHAERKLREAQGRLARTERSIRYWTRILADLKHERTRAVQPPLWPEEDGKEKS
jgi:hypothetical protein